MIDVQLKVVIREVVAVGAFFLKGLEITNSVFIDGVSFEAGGHNDSKCPVVIKNNIFQTFLDFGDCLYKGSFIFKENVLRQGSNLLGNQEKPYHVKFGEEVEIIDNLGDLYCED